MTQSAQMRLAIAGVGGRMGRALLEAAAAIPGAVISGSLEHAASPLLQTDAGLLSRNAAGVVVTGDLDVALASADVLIDFTRPEGTLKHIAACRRLGVNMVIGTTGFTTEEKKQIEFAANDIAIVFAPNMSVGVNVMLRLIALATAALHEQYDIEIIETHHKMKVDAPSGTALQLGEVAALAMGKPLNEIAVFDRWAGVLAAGVISTPTAEQTGNEHYRDRTGDLSHTNDLTRRTQEKKPGTRTGIGLRLGRWF